MELTRIYPPARFLVPTKILFGIGSVQKTGEEARALHAGHALLFTDKGLVKAGVLNSVLESLGSAGVEVTVWDEVFTNPTVELFEEAAAALRSTSADLLVAVGGGSSIDTAKIVGILDANPQPLLSLEGYGLAAHRRRLPLIAIETAAGSGSEVSEFAIVRDLQRNLKVGINGPFMFPDLAICDPLLTLTLPRRDTAEIGIDALSNAIESYLTRNAWPLSDALARQAMGLIFANLRRAVGDGQDLRAREGMMAGALLAGLSMSVGLGIPHALAEPIGGLYNLTHGLTVALSLPAGLAFCALTSTEKIADIAEAAGERTAGLSVRERAERGILVVQRLICDIGIPSAVEVGCRREDIPVLVKAVKAHDCLRESPRCPDEGEIRSLLEGIFQETPRNQDPRD
ncbi:MAG: iron-containing alcohol dehydrogenase [Coprothermobacterota bacterium]|nr:iron-containing alcohol dehydrogenase [Coprothermobacterota bacterium]